MSLSLGFLVVALLASFGELMGTDADYRTKREPTSIIVNQY